MNATVAQLTARSLLGRRRALLLLALPAIFVLFSGAVRWIADVSPDIGVSLLGGFALGTMVPLLGLIVGTGAIGPEIDDGSIVYLLSKPLNRTTIAVTKYAVAVGIVLVVAVVPTLLGGFILAGTADGVAWAYAAGAAAAGIGYCALFLLLAVLTRNAVVVGLLYALIWETLIGGFVPGAQALSIQQWALALTERLLGSEAAALGVASSVEFGTAMTLLLVVIVGGIGYAGMRLRTLRLTSDE
jgi:ABC-2 type transport system permease protein